MSRAVRDDLDSGEVKNDLRRWSMAFLSPDAGEQTFCIVGEWARFENLAAARPQMIGLLDTFRDDLEDLGGGVGVTDPVSGEMVLKLAATKPAAKKKASGKKAVKRKRRG